MTHVAGKSLDEWLNEFRQRISNAVRTQRVEDQLIDRVYEDERYPKYIWRFKKEEKEKHDAYIVSIIPEMEIITPVHVIVVAPLKEWIREPEAYAIEFLMDEVARLIALRETYSMIKSLLDEAKEFTSTETRLTKDDIKRVSDWVRSNDHFADTLIVHPLQYIELIENKEIIEAWKIRPLTEQLGRNFCGMIDALKVYQTPSINEKTGLLYEKSYSSFTRTPLTIEYDHPKYPRNLIVEEYCIAWFLDKTASAKITFS